MTCADQMGVGGRGWGPSPGKSPKTIGFLGILVGTPGKSAFNSPLGKRH